MKKLIYLILVILAISIFSLSLVNAQTATPTDTLNSTTILVTPKSITLANNTVQSFIVTVQNVGNIDVNLTITPLAWFPQLQNVNVTNNFNGTALKPLEERILTFIVQQAYNQTEYSFKIYINGELINVGYGWTLQKSVSSFIKNEGIIIAILVLIVAVIIGLVGIGIKKIKGIV